jgi:Spy/CpxP family protein refolding chaperone
MTRLNVILGTGLLLAGSAFAQDPGRTRPTAEEMVSRRIEHLSAELQLTAEQKTEATTIFNEEATAIRALQPQLREASTALRNAVKTTGLDADIERAAAQLGTLQGQMAAINGKAQARLRAILTPDQKTKLDASMDRGPGMGGGFGGPGRFGGRR